MTEYALIIGLIAIAVVAGLGAFGASLAAYLQGITDEIAAL